MVFVKTLDQNKEINREIRVAPEAENLPLESKFSLVSKKLNKNRSQKYSESKYSVIETKFTPEIENLAIEDKFSQIQEEVKKKSVVEQSETKSSEKESNFINPPQVVPDEKVNPSVTTVPLNGDYINHLTKWQFNQDYNFGSDINSHFNFQGVTKLDSKIKYSVSKDNIFTSEQTGNYLQVQTIKKNRETITVQKLPQTFQGFELKMTFTGNCIIPTTNSNQQCTYLPSLSSKNNIDTETFLPTKITVNSNVSEILTPETVEAIKQPGFQKGANNQDVAFELYIPRAGVVAGNSQTDRGKVSREDKIDNSLAFSFSRVRQIVKANDKKAVIGRTVRGNNLIVDDDNFLLNSAIQIGSELIPDIEPNLEASSNQVNPFFNKNIFLSANNTRLPANSLTIYHGGVGEAKHGDESSNKLNQLPAAKFNSFWLGLSPVTKYSYTQKSRYEAVSLTKITSQTGSEGGNSSGNNLSFQTTINGETFSSAALNDYYIQSYLSFLETDVNLVNTSIWKEETQYYPHLSITGNVTKYNEGFNYYGGIILAEKPNAYLGLDYSKVNSGGWLYRFSGIGYSNPNRDYYSSLQGNIVKSLKLNKNSNLLLSTGFNWGIDREKNVNDIVIDSQASSVTLGAKANLDRVSLGIVSFLGDILPDSRQNTLLLNLGIKLNNRFSLSGFFTPITESSSYSKFGTTASWKLGINKSSPRLNLQWFYNKYNFGKDQTGQDLKTNENIFQIQLKM